MVAHLVLLRKHHLKKMSHLISINILERLKSLADQELTLKIEPIRMQQQG